LLVQVTKSKAIYQDELYILKKPELQLTLIFTKLHKNIWVS